MHSALILALFFSAVQASIFDSISGIVSNNAPEQSDPARESKPMEETSLALLQNDPTDDQSSIDFSEGQSSGVVIRAKRYYGCGCCCGCGTMAPAPTAMPCCGCGCGCGYG
ncbi:unnamed protein product [Caenorhabditis bovis]|uniref:Secreted protein n=1 Tax=Caenorhabditis bovis TaxID=2654633 RepID=A0A8S1E920_9PELO|nr:unnamed protein product [Caenorhabditis bovis]